MTWALARALLFRRLRSPMRLLFLLLLFGQDLAQVLISGQAGPAEGAIGCLATLLLGAGLIGQERSDGSLALWLTRPLSRGQVVIAAWLAAAGGGGAVWTSLSLLRMGLTPLPAVDSTWAAAGWVEQGLTAACGSGGLAAVAVLFGALFRGLGGAAAHGGMAYLATTLAGLASESGRANRQRWAQEFLDVLLPVPRFDELLAPGGWSWLELLGPVSNAALALVVACLLLGRAQLSYSQRD